MLKKWMEGWLPISLINLFVFAPHFNASTYPDFALDKLVVVLYLLLGIVFLLSRFFYCLVATIVIAINVAYLHIVGHWGEAALSDRVTLALESPAGEQAEYLRNFFSLQDVAALAYAACCLLAITLVVRRRKASNAVFRGMAIMPMVVAELLISSNSRATKIPLIALPMEVYSQPVRAQRLKERNERVAAATQPAQCANEFDSILIVVGESASADRHALYGYAPNTPSPLREFGLTALNAISGANQTRLSVPLMLTSARVEAFDEFFDSKSLVTDLKECGYQTYWISNQSRSGQYDDNVASISKEADISIFMADDSDTAQHHFDEALAERISILPRGGKRAFFVHLAGSHIDYGSRYPAAFKPTEPPESSEALLSAQYDASMRYTDHVLAQILGMFDRRSLFFVYVSDHGEVLAGDVFGHGYIPAHQAE